MQGSYRSLNQLQVDIEKLEKEEHDGNENSDVLRKNIEDISSQIEELKNLRLDYDTKRHDIEVAISENSVRINNLLIKSAEELKDIENTEREIKSSTERMTTLEVSASEHENKADET